MVHIKVRPYYDESLNRLAILSQFVFIVTLYFGICYQAGINVDGSRSLVIQWTGFVCVLVISLVFSVYYFMKVYIELLKRVAQTQPLVFRFLTCGYSNLSNFRMKYLGWDA